jgi:hypothetical protein
MAIRRRRSGWTLSALAPCAGLVALSAALAGQPAKAPPQPPVNILDRALKGPMAGVEDIVFAARQLNSDPHWYANFGYYGPDANRKAYRDGGRLCRLNLRTGNLTVLLDDPKGGVRDPCVSYDGKRILFSYRKGGTEYYNLYEVNADGAALRRVTDAPFDDIEPVYLPDGDIVFVSSRCKRWVNCWLTQVAIMYRCGPDGRNIRPISSNNDHDNTPWVMPDGRLIYMRWEYVDRSQVNFHHLWVSNPDGSGQTIYFGNMYPGIVMIDAKPIPGTNKVVAIFSPGHGRKEHMGPVTIVDPDAGPDIPSMARRIGRRGDFRDPYAFSEDCFLVAAPDGIHLMDGAGNTQLLCRPTDALELHEPRPLVARPREPGPAPRTNPAIGTGCMVLADVTFGRNMEGVRPGEIRKLLILETLPMPVHYSGGMEPITRGGTFILERIVGTVPVEPDGSAYFEVPALRSIFFVAMDAEDRAVKRMQSFCSIMPGETVGCFGCHEERSRLGPTGANLLALRRPPSRIEPVAGVPDVIDFPRDIQPILDRHCLKCHDYDKRDGGAILSGDRGPMYSHSYITITDRKQVADGRNAFANRPPRSIGASASPLMKMIEPGHYEVKVTEQERRMVRYWIESGAAYPGTYAAVGNGMIGRYIENNVERNDAGWPSVAAAAEVIQRRCGRCHAGALALPLSPSHDAANRSRHIVYNLTRPEKSLMLLGPLAKAAGGYGTCQAKAQVGPTAQAPPVFGDTNDPDYQKILTMIRDAKKWLDDVKRFDMPGFRPNADYVREMKKYGVLPMNIGPNDPIDPYATDQAYWRSLWYQPVVQ